MAPNTPTLDNLLAAIRIASADPVIDWAETPVVLTGGFSAEMWRVRLTGGAGLNGDLVARVMPNPEVARRETAVQAHLADTGYPTPTVRLAAGPGPELDRAWMLMDHAPGDTLLGGLSGVSAFAQLPRIARALPDRLARHAAALHRISADHLRTTDDDATLLVERLLHQLLEIERDDLARVAMWLRQKRPATSLSVICHGDLHPFNVLSHPTGDTVLDWSSSRITDPAYDVAFTQLLLGHPPLKAPRPLAPLVAAAGRSLAHRFCATYDAIASTPIRPDQLAWFTNLHALRILTEVATWQALGELDQHPSHPFLSLQQPLADQLEHTTGIRPTRNDSD